MLDMGFAQDIEHIAGETRWRSQTMLFSATLEGDDQRLAGACWKIRIGRHQQRLAGVNARRSISGIYRADNSLSTRLNCFKHLLKQGEEATHTIVFVRKRDVHELVEMLRNAD